MTPKLRLRFKTLRTSSLSVSIARLQCGEGLEYVLTC